MPSAASRTAFILPLCAGLFGALGLVFSALAAHGKLGANGATASLMLLVHAPALLAIAVGVAGGYLSRLGLYGGYGMALGIGLFVTDITLRSAYGFGLFSFAAPTGASLAIVAWLLVGLSGFGKKAQGQ